MSLSPYSSQLHGNGLFRIIGHRFESFTASFMALPQCSIPNRGIFSSLSLEMVNDIVFSPSFIIVQSVHQVASVACFRASVNRNSSCSRRPTCGGLEFPFHSVLTRSQRLHFLLFCYLPVYCTLWRCILLHCVFGVRLLSHCCIFSAVEIWESWVHFGLDSGMHLSCNTLGCSMEILCNSCMLLMAWECRILCSATIPASTFPSHSKRAFLVLKTQKLHHNNIHYDFVNNLLETNETFPAIWYL